MLKLRILLLYDYLYYLLLVLAIIYAIFNINITFKSKYNINDTNFNCYIDSIKIDGNKLDMIIIGKEKLSSTYYFETEEEVLSFKKNINLGDRLVLKGELIKPSSNTVFNAFNYNTYLKTKRINYILNILEYKKISNNKDFIYSVKNLMIKRINSYKSGNYINAFILGDSKGISNKVTDAYQSIGISHLLAISGGNITFFSVILLFILKKINIYENKRYIITSLILLFYMVLVGCSASIVRAVIFFTLLSINKIYYFNIKTINIFYLTLVIVLFNNPYIVYDVGFQFSFVISYYLILFQDYLVSNKNYIVSLFRISLVSFLASFPIVINNFYQINIFSIIYNIFYVPFVSVIVFPFSILTFIFKILDPIMVIFVNILENSSIFFSNILIGKFIISRPSLILIIIYYLLSLLIISNLNKKKYFWLFIYVLVIIFHYNKNYFIKDSYMIMIDVSQGDSMLLYSNNKSMLIDTGGVLKYGVEEWEKRESSSLYKNRIDVLLKSLGIRKLDYLVLTHGDTDHMGESYELVKSMKVDKVIFNSNDYNKNEVKLINILKNKDINYFKDKEKNKYVLGNFNITSLNTNLEDENDSSIVFYLNINNKKILLMGDASIKSEEYILSKYNIGNIDIIKVGHHGSRTSTSLNLINNIRPKYAFISVGLDNKFNHPNKEILDRLSNFKIYRTDLDGSVEVKLNKGGYKIKICSL